MASSVPILEQRTRSGTDAPNRILLRNVPWDLYERFRADEANRFLRMSYDNGELELMSPSQSHGEIESRFPIFVMEIADVLNIDCKAVGTTTWKKATEGKAKEADACFYLANFDRVRHKQIDLNNDPPPDLAIEVEISRSSIDALNLYATLGVPEIWRFDGERLHIHVRQGNRLYIEVDRSLAFPVLLRTEIVAWMIQAEEMDHDIAWKREVRQWAQAVLLPRLEPV